VQLAEMFSTDPSKLAQFLCSIQLRNAVYWQSINALYVMEVHILPTPDFTELLNSVRIKAWIPPLLQGAPLVDVNHSYETLVTKAK